MASSLSDFFAKLHEEITLPSSGLVVAIRQPDLLSLISLGELPMPSVPQPEGTTDALASTMSPRDINRYTERVIAEGVITPPFSDARDDQGRAIYSQHYIHVCELDSTDKNFLSTRLLEKMGLTPEAAQSAQSFRADPLSPADSATGAGV
jgi:hypothetical protein